MIRNAIVRTDRRGFTLLEMMTVIMVIGLLALISAVNFLAAKRTSERNMCVSNLRQIQAIVSTWAIDTGAAGDSAVTTADLVPGYVRVWPKEGAIAYPVPATAAARPVCPNAASRPDHSL